MKFELEKKWVLVSLDILSSLLRLKSIKWEEFFVSFIYSDWIKNSLSEKILGFNVKSALLEITLKYGTVTEVPSLLEELNYGIKSRFSIDSRIGMKKFWKIHDWYVVNF